MSEMIHRVAKAQFLNAHEGDPPESWDLLDDDYRALWLKAARVGVEAVREPTDHMEFTGWHKLDQLDMQHSGEIRELYRAMIDAALSHEQS